MSVTTMKTTKHLVEAIRKGERLNDSTMKGIANQLESLEAILTDRLDILQRYEDALKMISCIKKLAEFVSHEDAIECAERVANRALNGEDQDEAELITIEPRPLISDGS